MSKEKTLRIFLEGREATALEMRGREKGEADIMLKLGVVGVFS